MSKETKFKVGDKVKIISCTLSYCKHIGKTVTLISRDTNKEYWDMGDIHIHSDKELELVEEKFSDNSFSEFNQLVDEMKELHSKKSHDYDGDTYLSSLMTSESIGIPAWKGVLLKIQQKVSRLEKFAKSEELKVSDESMEDTLKDLAVYAILDLILYRKLNDRKDI